jgi:hypothetical protein
MRVKGKCDVSDGGEKGEGEVQADKLVVERPPPREVGSGDAGKAGDPVGQSPT